MPATLATMDAALKETWTQDRLENQLYDDNPFLDDLERTTRYHVGDKAVTPLIVNRNGGYTAHPAAGSTALNPAGHVGSAQAEWRYTYHAQQIAIQRAALDGTGEKAIAVADALDTEVEGGMSEIRKQLTRQAFGNGDALIARCGATAASATVALDTTGLGPDALARGHLHPGLTVDIGTAAAEASVIADAAVLDVDEANSTITIPSAVTTSGSHFVSVANARSGAVSFEMNGLQNVVSQTADLGGLTVAANRQWKAAHVDTSTTTLTLDAMYRVRRQVRQRTGGDSTDYLVTSLKQEEAFYKLLQMQVRFDSDRQIGAGSTEQARFAGHTIKAHPDCPDRSAFFVSKKHLFLCAIDKPYWVNKHEGGNILKWSPGTTAFVSALFYDVQLATNRRNAHAALTALTA